MHATRIVIQLNYNVGRLDAPGPGTQPSTTPSIGVAGDGPSIWCCVTGPPTAARPMVKTCSTGDTVSIILLT